MRVSDVHPAPRPTEARPVHTRTQVLGLAIFAAMLLLLSVAAAGADEVVAAVAGGAALVLTGLAIGVWRIGGALRLIAMILLLLLAGAGFVLAFGLAHPASFIDFAAGLGLVTGTLLGVGGGVASLLARRRGRTATEPTWSERLLTRAVATVLVAGLGASFILTWQAQTEADPAAAQGATRVDMRAFAFDPTEIRVRADDPRLLVSNDDAFLHDLTVGDLGAQVVLTSGSSAVLDLGDVSPGTYLVICTLHADPNAVDPLEAGMMAAWLVVE
jgi:plastocyanin